MTKALARPEPGDLDEQHHYQAVLESLQKKKRDLEIAIETVSRLVSEVGQPAEGAELDVPKPPAPRQALRLSEAIKTAFDQIGGPARNADIKRELLLQGYGAEAANLDVSIIQALKRLSAANVVTKVGRGLWAIRK